MAFISNGYAQVVPRCEKDCFQMHYFASESEAPSLSDLSSDCLSQAIYQQHCCPENMYAKPMEKKVFTPPQTANVLTPQYTHHTFKSCPPDTIYGNKMQNYYDERTNFMAKTFNNLSLVNDMSKKCHPCPVHSKGRNSKHPVDMNVLEECYWAKWKPKSNEITSYKTESRQRVELGNFVQCNQCMKFIEKNPKIPDGVYCIHTNLENIDSESTEASTTNKNETINEDDEDDMSQDECGTTGTTSTTKQCSVCAAMYGNTSDEFICQCRTNRTIATPCGDTNCSRKKSMETDTNTNTTTKSKENLTQEMISAVRCCPQALTSCLAKTNCGQGRSRCCGTDNGVQLDTHKPAHISIAETPLVLKEAISSSSGGNQIEQRDMILHNESQQGSRLNVTNDIYSIPSNQDQSNIQTQTLTNLNSSNNLIKKPSSMSKHSIRNEEINVEVNIQTSDSLYPQGFNQFLNTKVTESVSPSTLNPDVIEDLALTPVSSRRQILGSVTRSNSKLTNSSTARQINIENIPDISPANPYTQSIEIDTPENQSPASQTGQGRFSYGRFARKTTATPRSMNTRTDINPVQPSQTVPVVLPSHQPSSNNERGLSSGRISTMKTHSYPLKISGKSRRSTGYPRLSLK